MKNLILVAGNKVQEISEILSNKYKVVFKYENHNDLFNDIIQDNLKSTDIDCVVVTQNSLGNGSNIIDNISELQEALLISSVKEKVYFILTDKDIFDQCNCREDIIVYDNTKILLVDTLNPEKLYDIIDGNYENRVFTSRVIDKETIKEENYEEDYVEEYIEDSIEDSIEEKQEGGWFNKIVGLVINKKNRKEITGSNKVFIVCGDRGSGVSTTASNIAEGFSSLKKKTLLIDMDTTRKFQSVIYDDFTAEASRRVDVQNGTFIVLQNPSKIKQCKVSVNSYLDLIGMGKYEEDKFEIYGKEEIEELTDVNKISSLIGIAKNEYDAVVVDLPTELIEKLEGIILVADKVILCTENSVHGVHNLIDLLVDRFKRTRDIYMKMILDKSCIVLTKYSKKSMYYNKLIDKNMVKDILRGSIYEGITVEGKIDFSEDFYRQLNESQRVFKLNKDIENDVILLIRHIIN